MEILFAVLNAIIVGFFCVFRKLALKKSRESVVLVLYTTVAFLLSLIWLPFGVGMSFQFVLIHILKGLLLAISWFVVLKVLKDADLSLVTITNIISAVLTFVLGIIIFKETAGIWQIVGSVVIVAGVAVINLLDRKNKSSVKWLHFVLLIISALITTFSNIVDKYTTTHLSLQQVQFWFLLFVTIFSWIFFLIECGKKKEFLIKKADLRNFWIYLIGVFLFVADIFLILAYKTPGSQMITISIIVKMQSVIAVLAGIIIFKEKNVWQKLLLTALVVLGVLLITIF